MWLNTTWFVLYVVIITGYVILDGFDLGVGMLSPFLARDDTEQRDPAQQHRTDLGRQRGVARARRWSAVRSVPVRVRLAVLRLLHGHDAGAAGADPAHRGDRVPLQARERPVARRPGTGSSSARRSGSPCCSGLRSATWCGACSWRRDGNIAVDLIDLLNPYSLLVGVTGVVMLSLHGAIFLTQKVEGDLLDRVRRVIPTLGVTFFALGTATVVRRSHSNRGGRQLPRPPMDGAVPAPGARRHPGCLAARGTRRLPVRVRRLGRDHRSAHGVGRRRALPDDAALLDQPRERPHGPQRSVGGEHAAR